MANSTFTPVTSFDPANAPVTGTSPAVQAILAAIKK